MNRSPPVLPSAVLRPAAIVIVPPAPLLPLPTVMLTAPPVPPEDAADPIEIDPVVPELDVPELKLSRPLVPSTPAFADLMITAPLVVAMP